MSYLLDTCALSELSRPLSDPGVVHWLEGQMPETLFLSVLSVAEIERGIARLEPSQKKSQLTTFLEDVLNSYGDRILPLTVSICGRWGQLSADLERKGRVLPLMDSLVAVSAIENNMTVVTRNVKDFADTGVQTLNIWSKL
jgi:predicted nucleic acid-binding protein